MSMIMYNLLLRAIHSSPSIMSNLLVCAIYFSQFTVYSIHVCAVYFLPDKYLKYGKIRDTVV